MLISSHVALSCRDPLASEHFYSSYFGFQRARVISLGAEQIVFIKSGSTYLELFQSKGEFPHSPFEADGPAYPGLRHIAFQVENVDELLLCRPGKPASVGRSGSNQYGGLIFRYRTRIGSEERGAKTSNSRWCAR